MALFHQSSAESRGARTDPSREHYLRLSEVVARHGLSAPQNHHGSSERAAIELIGRFAFAERELQRQPSENISVDEGRARWRLGVVEAIHRLIPEAQRLAHHDYDQAVGMLGMVRAGKILFRHGVDTIKKTPMSPELDAVIKGLRRVYSVAGYDAGSIDPQGTLAAFSFHVPRPDSIEGKTALFGLGQGETLDAAFARDAIMLMRLVHPLGLCPLLNIPGRTHMGFSGDRAGIDFGPRLGNVEIESNSARTKITYIPAPGPGQRSGEPIRIQNGEAILLGRPLTVGALFGIHFDPVHIEPGCKIPENEISRAAYLIVRDYSGGVYLFDRGARHSFGFWESYGGRESRYRFDPRATLNNQGRFTTGQTSLSSPL
ncbi:MAG: hypothetical protein QY326_08265 [Bdellovibrionota bacterium]|nr:MAG: hypothetical protein QY326_08265 [Bdellovibrionota bacterium]